MELGRISTSGTEKPSYRKGHRLIRRLKFNQPSQKLFGLTEREKLEREGIIFDTFAAFPQRGVS